MPAIADRKRLLFRAPLVILTLGTTAAASAVFFDVLIADGWYWLDAPLLILFTLLFLWVAFSFHSATIGFFQCLRRWPHAMIPLRTKDVVRDADAVLPRTAVLMPVYNEDPKRVLAGLRAMHESLSQTPHHEAFDFFILSDTTNPEVWLQEEEAYANLLDALGEDCRVYYRRRPKNVARKSGNITEFLERWGNNYPYMIVLDADSVMEGATMVEMVFRMDDDPKLGILQVPPVPVNRESLFARVQQFAASVYGEIFTTGFAMWTQTDGNYYGHNAIIRVQPFIQHCGLPKLPGKEPLGGEILSHDFVEAALMRKAGYVVRVAEDLGGSYEECPTTLLDFAMRDQRWCQGNLQHTRLLFWLGFHPVSRLHFCTGVMSYISSPIWLLTMVLGVLAVALSPGNSDPDSAFMVGVEASLLFVVTMSFLFLPRLWSFMLILKEPEQLASHGGELHLAASILLEVVISIFIAPVLMLYHSMFVVNTLLGRSVSWSAQQRDEACTPLSQSFRIYAPHMIIGATAAVAIWVYVPSMRLWLSPVLLPLIVAAPMATLLSLASVGRWLRRRGIFLIHEETDTPAILRRQNELIDHTPTQSDEPIMNRVIREPRLFRLHVGLLGDNHPPRATPERLTEIEAVAADTGPASLNRDDQLALLSDRDALRRLHTKVWTAATA